MKKLFALTLALAMALSMAACGSNTQAPASSAAPAASAPASEASKADASAAPGAETPNIDAIKAKGKLVMATNAAFPPFEYIKDNAPAGVDVDIANEIAKDLGVELQVDDMEFNAIIPAVQNGKADFGAAGMTINDERKQQVDFSVEYVRSAQFCIIPKGSTITVEDLKAKGKKIGVQEGTTGQFYATGEDIKNDEASEDVLGYENALIAAQDLMNGKCDAVIIDKLPAESIVAANSDKLELMPEPLTEESYAISVKKGNADLLAAINKTLERLVAEGKVDEFVINHTAA